MANNWFNVPLKERGQVSIEIIMLVMVIALFIQSIVVPSLDISAGTAKEVTRMGQARYAAEKLANTIDAVHASAGENKRTITLFIPARTVIGCDVAPSITWETGDTTNFVCVNNVCFESELDEILLAVASTPSSCTDAIDGDGSDKVCSKNILINGCSGGAGDCASNSINCSGLTIDNSTNDAGIVRTVEIEKDNAGVTNVTAT